MANTKFPTQEGSDQNIRFLNTKDHTPPETKANYKLPHKRRETKSSAKLNQRRQPLSNQGKSNQAPNSTKDANSP
jgi:hypothetical protein